MNKELTLKECLLMINKEGEGILILKNGDVYKGIWYGNTKQSPKKPTEKITEKQFFNIVKKLIRTKTVLEPEVKIIL